MHTTYTWVMRARKVVGDESKYIENSTECDRILGYESAWESQEKWLCVGMRVSIESVINIIMRCDLFMKNSK